MKVQRVGSSANKASLPWPKTSRSRHCSEHKQLIQLTQHQQHYHQWQHCTEQEYCMPKKTLSISCHSLTVALESDASGTSFSLLLDLSNNAKCLATEQGKQVSDSCSFQLTMILTKKWQFQQPQLVKVKMHRVTTEKAQHLWWVSM